MVFYSFLTIQIAFLSKFSVTIKNKKLKSDSHVSENFCQIKIFLSLIRNNIIMSLFGV